MTIELLSSGQSESRMKMSFRARNAEQLGLDAQAFSAEIKMTGVGSNEMNIEISMTITTRSLGEVTVNQTAQLTQGNNGTSSNTATLEISAQGETSTITRDADGKLMIDGEPATPERASQLQAVLGST